MKVKKCKWVVSAFLCMSMLTTMAPTAFAEEVEAADTSGSEITSESEIPAETETISKTENLSTDGNTPETPDAVATESTSGTGSVSESDTAVKEENLLTGAGTVSDAGTDDASESHDSENAAGDALPQAVNGVIILESKNYVLSEDKTASVVVPDGVTASLDLNGHNLTDDSNHADHTIIVCGNLTITGTGVVDNITDKKAALYNKGSVTLEGGTFTRSQENGKSEKDDGGNSYHTVVNHGDMAIHSGVTMENRGKCSAVLENGYHDYCDRDGMEYPELSIKDGKFTGGYGTVFNDGNARAFISGGDFYSDGVAAFCNMNIAEIQGGTFTGKKYSVKQSGSGPEDLIRNHTEHRMDISGGTFSFAGFYMGTVNISGGTFEDMLISECIDSMNLSGGDYLLPSAGSFRYISMFVEKGYIAVPIASKSDRVHYRVVPAVSTSSFKVQQSVKIITNNNRENVEGSETLFNVVKNLSVGKLQDSFNTKIASVDVPADTTSYLQERGITVGNNAKIFTVIQPELEIDLWDIDRDNKSFELFIAPKYRTILTTADPAKEKVQTSDEAGEGSGSEVNAVVITDDQNLICSDDVSVPLPSEFVNEETTQLYVELLDSHIQAENVKTSDKDKSLTITGMSLPSHFTVFAGNPVVAQIGDVAYSSLDDALWYVTDGGTIILKKSGQSAMTYARDDDPFTFTIDGRQIHENAAITVSEDCTLSQTGKDNYITYTVKPISGSGSDDSRRVDVVYSSNGSVNVSAKKAVPGTRVTVTLTPNKGYYTDGPVVTDEKGNKIGVTKKVENRYTFVMPSSPVKVDPVFSEKAKVIPCDKNVVKIDITSGTDSDTARALKTVISETVVDDGVLAKAAREASDNISVSDSQLIEIKKKLNSDDVSVVVQPYLEISLKDVNKNAKHKSFTLDIKPKYRTVATSADFSQKDVKIVTKADKAGDETVNAVVIGSDIDSETLEINEPIEVTIPLPEGFAKTGQRLYVEHTAENGKRFIYSGRLSNDNKTLSFTNPHGFSEFKVSADNTAVAEINSADYSVGYTSLQDAVDLVGENETIRLKKSGGSAVVHSAKVFMVDGNGGHKADITAASGYDIDSSVNGDITTYKVTQNNASSSSGYVVSYAVNAVDAANGSVSVSTKNAARGETVTVTVKPDDGYTLDKLTVTDRNGAEIAVQRRSETEYTFIMPNGAVTVNEKFVPKSAPAAFADVLDTDYFSDAVKWALQNNITEGTTATTFSPYDICTRGQVVTFLYRMAGSPEVDRSVASGITDVPSDKFCADAVAWALEEGITVGTTPTTFSPDAACTRGQAVTFLYRYEKSPAPTQGRAFMDVRAGTFCTDAVSWAAEKGITAGTTSTTFSPNNGCQRAQVITFLYRDMISDS